jgi:chromosome segregation ATPase
MSSNPLLIDHIDTLCDKIVTLVKDIYALREENKVLDRDNALLHYGAKSAEWELNTLRENNHLLQKERDSLKMDNHRLFSALTFAQSDLANAKKDYDSLKADNAILHEALDGDNVGIKAINKEITTLRTDLSGAVLEKNDALRFLDSERKVSSTQYKEIQALRADLSSIRAAVTDSNDEHHEIINSLKYQLLMARAELDTARSSRC